MNIETETTSEIATDPDTNLNSPTQNNNEKINFFQLSKNAVEIVTEEPSLIAYSVEEVEPLPSDPYHIAKADDLKKI